MSQTKSAIDVVTHFRLDWTDYQQGLKDLEAETAAAMERVRKASGGAQIPLSVSAQAAEQLRSIVKSLADELKAHPIQVPYTFVPTNQIPAGNLIGGNPQGGTPPGQPPPESTGGVSVPAPAPRPSAPGGIAMVPPATTEPPANPLPVSLPSIASNAESAAMTQAAPQSPDVPVRPESPQLSPATASPPGNAAEAADRAVDLGRAQLQQLYAQQQRCFELAEAAEKTGNTDESRKQRDAAEAMQAQIADASGNVGRLTDAQAEAHKVQDQLRDAAGRVSGLGKTGSETTVRTPRKAYPATYKLVEASAVQPSHDPFSFSPNPRHPGNERDYRDAMERLKVINNAKNFDPQFVTSNNIDAANGPPVVLPGGEVMGGNSRAMSIARVYADSDRAGKLKQDMLNAAASFGIDPAQHQDMKQPMLVRELQENVTSPSELMSMSREMQGGFTLDLSANRDAASRGNQFFSYPHAPQMLEEMLSDGGSVRDVLGNPSKSQRLIKLLQDSGAIKPTEIARYALPQGGFSDDGKKLVERILASSVIQNPDLLEDTPPQMVNKITGNLAAFSATGAKEGWGLGQPVTQALTAYHRGRDQTESADPEKLIDWMEGREQLSLVPDDIQGQPHAKAILRSLVSENTAQFKERASEYRDLAGTTAPGQARMFGKDITASEAFSEAFGDLLPEDQRKTLESTPIPTRPELAVRDEFTPVAQEATPESVATSPVIKPVFFDAGSVSKPKEGSPPPERHTAIEPVNVHSAVEPDAVSSPGEAAALTNRPNETPASQASSQADADPSSPDPERNARDRKHWTQTKETYEAILADVSGGAKDPLGRGAPWYKTQIAQLNKLLGISAPRQPVAPALSEVEGPAISEVEGAAEPPAEPEPIIALPTAPEPTVEPPRQVTPPTLGSTVISPPVRPPPPGNPPSDLPPVPRPGKMPPPEDSGGGENPLARTIEIGARQPAGPQTTPFSKQQIRHLAAAGRAAGGSAQERDVLAVTEQTMAGQGFDMAAMDAGTKKNLLDARIKAETERQARKEAWTAYQAESSQKSLAASPDKVQSMREELRVNTEHQAKNAGDDETIHKLKQVEAGLRLKLIAQLQREIEYAEKVGDKAGADVRRNLAENVKAGGGLADTGGGEGATGEGGEGAGGPGGGPLPPIEPGGIRKFIGRVPFGPLFLIHHALQAVGSLYQADEQRRMAMESTTSYADVSKANLAQVKQISGIFYGVPEMLAGTAERAFTGQTTGEHVAEMAAKSDFTARQGDQLLQSGLQRMALSEQARQQTAFGEVAPAMIAAESGARQRHQSILEMRQQAVKPLQDEAANLRIKADELRPGPFARSFYNDWRVSAWNREADELDRQANAKSALADRQAEKFDQQQTESNLIEKKDQVRIDAMKAARVTELAQDRRRSGMIARGETFAAGRVPLETQLQEATKLRDLTAQNRAERLAARPQDREKLDQEAADMQAKVKEAELAVGNYDMANQYRMGVETRQFRGEAEAGELSLQGDPRTAALKQFDTQAGVRREQYRKERGIPDVGPMTGEQSGAMEQFDRKATDDRKLLEDRQNAQRELARQESLSKIKRIEGDANDEMLRASGLSFAAQRDQYGRNIDDQIHMLREKAKEQDLVDKKAADDLRGQADAMQKMRPMMVGALETAHALQFRREMNATEAQTRAFGFAAVGVDFDAEMTVMLDRQKSDKIERDKAVAAAEENVKVAAATKDQKKIAYAADALSEAREKQERGPASDTAERNMAMTRASMGFAGESAGREAQIGGAELRARGADFAAQVLQYNMVMDEQIRQQEQRVKVAKEAADKLAKAGGAEKEAADAESDRQEKRLGLMKREEDTANAAMRFPFERQTRGMKESAFELQMESHYQSRAAEMSRIEYQRQLSVQEAGGNADRINAANDLAAAQIAQAVRQAVGPPKISTDPLQEWNEIQQQVLVHRRDMPIGEMKRREQEIRSGNANPWHLPGSPPEVAGGSDGPPPGSTISQGHWNRMTAVQRQAAMERHHKSHPDLPSDKPPEGSTISQYRWEHMTAVQRQGVSERYQHWQALHPSQSPATYHAGLHAAASDGGMSGDIDRFARAVGDSFDAAISGIQHLAVITDAT